MVGTPLYMAPELWPPQRDSGAGGHQRTSKAADIFSFGVIMWEVIHGRTAWAQYLNESGLPPKELATDYNAMMAFRPRFYDTTLEEEGEAAGEIMRSAVAAGPSDGSNTALVTLCRLCLEEHPLRRPSFAQIRESLEEIMQGLKYPGAAADAGGILVGTVL